MITDAVNSITSPNVGRVKLFIIRARDERFRYYLQMNEWSSLTAALVTLPYCDLWVSAHVVLRVLNCVRSAGGQYTLYASTRFITTYVIYPKGCFLISTCVVSASSLLFA